MHSCWDIVNRFSVPKMAGVTGFITTTTIMIIHLDLEVDQYGWNMCSVLDMSTHC